MSAAAGDGWDGTSMKERVKKREVFEHIYLVPSTGPPTFAHLSLCLAYFRPLSLSLSF